MATKKAKLTARERKVIQSMCFIAQAGDGDGDYASWRTSDFSLLDSIITKMTAEVQP